MPSRLAAGHSGVLRLVTRYNKSETAGFPTNGGGPEYAINRQAQTQNAREIVSGIAWYQQATSRWLYNVEMNAFDRGARAFVPAPSWMRRSPRSRLCRRSAAQRTFAVFARASRIRCGSGAVSPRL